MVELQLSSAIFRRNDFASFWSGSGTMSSFLTSDPPHSVRYSKITVSNSGLCLTQSLSGLCSWFVHIICMHRGCDLIRAVLNGPGKGSRDERYDGRATDLRERGMAPERERPRAQDHRLFHRPREPRPAARGRTVVVAA